MRKLHLILLLFFLLFTKSMLLSQHKTPDEIYQSAIKNTDYYNAVLELNKYSEKDTGNIKPYILRAKLFYYTEQVDDALGECFAALKIDNNNPDAYAIIGAVNLSAGDYENAMRFFDKSLNIDHNNLFALLYKGKLYYEQMKFKDAIRLCDNLLSLSPNDKNALSIKGLSYLKMNVFEDSYECFKSLLDLGMRDKYTYYNTAICFNYKKDKDYKDYDEAISYLSKAISLDSNFAEAYYHRANFYVDYQEYKINYYSNLYSEYFEAMHDFDAASKLNPELKEAFIKKYKIAKLLYQDDYTGRYLRDLISSDPKNALKYYIETGDIMLDNNQFVNALVAYEQAVRINPSLLTELKSKFNNSVHRKVQTEKLLNSLLSFIVSSVSAYVSQSVESGTFGNFFDSFLTMDNTNEVLNIIFNGEN